MLQKKAMIDAIGERCRLCMWYDRSKIRGCRATSCPNHKTKKLNLFTMSNSELLALIESVCRGCSSAYRGYCQESCPYWQFDLSPVRGEQAQYFGLIDTRIRD